MAETARPASVLGRLAGLVIAHRKLTVLAWLAVAVVPVKIFATGMAVGILLDATIIRTLILPAAISFLGEWAWWPSPLRAHRGSMAGLGSTDQLASFREPPPAGDGQLYLQSRDRHGAPAPRNHF